MNTAFANPQRKMAYDVIRIAAILMVILIHVSAYMVICHQKDGASEYIVSNIMNGIGRPSNALFIMLSGALLLNEDKPFDARRFYKKSLVWMLFLCFGWMLFYSLHYGVFLPLELGNEPSAEAFWKYFLALGGSRYAHMWYMFFVIGLYLMVPVLRLFVKRENTAYIFWMIVGCFFVQFLPTTLNALVPDGAVTTFTGFVSGFHLEPFSGFMGYVLLGWYLTNVELDKKTRTALYAAGILATAASIVIVLLTVLDKPMMRAYMYGDGVPGFLAGIAIFVLIRRLCGDKTDAGTALQKVSTHCFGVFLVHVMYLDLFTQVLLPYESFSAGPLLYILLVFLITVAASFLTVAAVDRIPGVRRIFYLK